MSEAEPAALSEESFTCPICLELLSLSPTTILCGHTFCMGCLKNHWDEEDQKGVYTCPTCRQTFTPRPLVSRNPLIASMMRKLRTPGVQALSSHVQSMSIQCYAGPGDVECEDCKGRKLKAVKSCLECHASYCETHLKAHLMIPGQNHTVIDAKGQLQDRICSRHNKVLELFCRTDQSCICYQCLMGEHKGHDTVTASEEKTDTQKLVGESQRKCKQKIKKTEAEMQELSNAVDSFKNSAEEVTKDVERMLSIIHRNSLSYIHDLIRAQENAEISRVKNLQKRMEQEIADLKRTVAELEDLSHIEDDIHFLKSAGSFTGRPLSAVSSHMSMTERFSFETFKEHVAAMTKQMEEKFDSILKQQEVKITAAAIDTQIIKSIEYTDAEVHVRGAGSKGILHPNMSAVPGVITDTVTREELMKYYCYFTLDPNTVHSNLFLPEGNRAVERGNELYTYSDHPKRFGLWPQVLCREVVSGRCYWEVAWSGACVNVTVAYGHIIRKGENAKAVFGCNDMSWSLEVSKMNCFFWHKNRKTRVRLVGSSSIGVYVDHSSGTLAFFSISNDTVKLLHREQTTFTDSLFPGFSLNAGSSVKLL